MSGVAETQEVHSGHVTGGEYVSGPGVVGLGEKQNTMVPMKGVGGDLGCLGRGADENLLCPNKAQNQENGLFENVVDVEIGLTIDLKLGRIVGSKKPHHILKQKGKQIEATSSTFRPKQKAITKWRSHLSLKRQILPRQFQLFLDDDSSYRLDVGQLGEKGGAPASKI